MIGGTRERAIAKSGYEMDVASKYARRIYKFTQRPGVCARYKRAMRRRLRRELRAG